jgi:superoxide dismutase, Cu-Zn family
VRRALPLTVAAAAVAVFVASPAIAGSDRVRADGELVRWSEEVLEGARATVTAAYDASARTTVVLEVEGLLPDTEYGAHVHVDGCGRTPDDAGPTFQNDVPARPELVHSRLYANRFNEIWLDLTTDEAGAGRKVATVRWQFAPWRRPGSVVLHEHHTSTGEGPGPLAGVAGDAIACLDVEF